MSQYYVYCLKSLQICDTKKVYFVLILYLYQAKLNIDRDTSGISHKGCLNSVHNQLATLPSIFLLLYGVDFGASV